MRFAWLVLFASVAYADSIELPTPTLSISTDDWATRVERIAVSIRSAPETSWITISLAGREDRVVGVWLGVPAGTRVFGLGVADDRGGVWGRPVYAGDARSQFHHRVVRGMLEWTREDRYRLYVETPVTLEIAMQLPPLAELAIDAEAGVLGVDVDGTKRLVAKRSQRRDVIDLGDVAGVTGPCATCASERVSIVAAKAHVTEFLEPLPIARNHGFIASRDIDKSIVRRYVKRHYPQLRRCYMQVAQWNPSVKGGVILSFMIQPDGTIAWAKPQESDLPPAVTECLVGNVLRWEFPPAEGHVQVNYPLEFRLAE